MTAFVIRPKRDRAAFHDLVGPTPPTLTTDRYGVYSHLPGDRRLVCWAHLRRDFQAMIDRRNAGSPVGEDLLAHADLLFAHWQRVRDGTWTRAGFRRRYASWLRTEVRTLLDRGAASACATTAGCAGRSGGWRSRCGRSHRRPGWNRRTTRRGERCGYAYFPGHGVILLGVVYAKGDKADLSAAERAAVKSLLARFEAQLAAERRRREAANGQQSEA